MAPHCSLSVERSAFMITIFIKAGPSCPVQLDLVDPIESVGRVGLLTQSNQGGTAGVWLGVCFMSVGDWVSAPFSVIPKKPPLNHRHGPLWCHRKGGLLRA